jgi:hypothetical protein
VTQRFFETWARGIRAMETVLEETTLADLCKPETSAIDVLHLSGKFFDAISE